MSTNNIQVAIRVRPLIKREILEKKTERWGVQDTLIYETDSKGHSCGEPYCFDHIFDQKSTNHDIFQKVCRPLIKSYIDGFNATIFAYGQTSSGKTHTMNGSINEEGLIGLSIAEIFNTIDTTPNKKYLLRASYIEIYNEKLNDLLDKENKDLKIRENFNGMISTTATEKIVTSRAQIYELMKIGEKNRQIGETNMNERSSRSHTIFRIVIEVSSENESDEAIVQVSSLNLVDLAGSERVAQTKATGVRLREGGNINKSLSILSNVIRQLSEGQEFISFRDSKVTRILQNSLGGNANTLIIANVTTTSDEVTHSTLSFAQRAKSIKNKPQVNVVVDSDAVTKKLVQQTIRLRKELEDYRHFHREQSKKISELEKTIVSLDSNFVPKPQRKLRRHTIGGQVLGASIRFPMSSIQEQPESLLLYENPPDLLESSLEPSMVKEDRASTSSAFCVNEGDETKEPASPVTPKSEKSRLEFNSKTPEPILRTRLKQLKHEYDTLLSFTNTEKLLDQEEISDKAEIKRLKDELFAYIKEIDDLNALIQNTSKEQFDRDAFYEKSLADKRKEIIALQDKIAELNNQLTQKTRAEVNVEELKKDHEYTLEYINTKHKKREAELLNQLQEASDSLIKKRSSPLPTADFTKIRLLETKIKNIQSQLENSEDKYLEAIQDLDNEKKINQKLKEELDSVPREMSDLKSKLILLETVLQSNDSLSFQGGEKIEELNAFINQLKTKLNQREKEKTNLEHENKNLQEKLTHSQENIKIKEKLTEQNEAITAKLTELQEQLSQREKEKSDLEHENKNLQEQLTHSQENIKIKEKLTEQNEAITAKLTKLQEQLNQLRKEKTDLEHENKNLQEQLTHSQVNINMKEKLIEQNEAITAKLTELQEQLNQLRKEKTDLEHENKNLQEKLTHSQENINIKETLNEQNEAITAELAKLQDQLSQREKEKSDLEHENKNLQEKLTHSQENIKIKEKLTEQNEAIAAKLTKLQEQLNQLRKEKSDLEHENKNLQEQLTHSQENINIKETLNEQNEAITAELAKLQDQLSQREKEKSDLEHENKNLQEKLTHSQVNINMKEKLIEQNEAITAKLTELQEQLNQLRKEKTDLEHENKNLQEQLTHSQENNNMKEKLTEQIEAITAKLTKLQEQLIQLRKEKTDLKHENKNLQEQLVHSQENIKIKEKLTEQNEAITAKLTELQKQLNRLRKEKNDLEHENKNLQEQLTHSQENINMKEKFNEENETMTAKLAKLQDQLDQQEKEKSDLEHENKTLREEVKHSETLKEKLDEIQEQNETITAKINELQVQLNQLRKDKNDLEHQNENLQEQLKHSETNNKLIINKLNESKLQIETLKEKLIEMQQQNKKLAAKLTELQEQKEKLIESQQLKIRKEELIEELNKKSENLQARIKDKELKLNSLTNEYTELSEQKSVLKQQIEKLLTEEKLLIEKIANLQQNNPSEAKSETELMQLKQRVEYLESEKEHLSNSVSHLQNKCTTLERQEIELNNLLKQQTEKYSQLKRINAKLDVELVKTKIASDKLNDIKEKHYTLTTEYKELRTIKHELDSKLEKQKNELHQCALKIKQLQDEIDNKSLEIASLKCQLVKTSSQLRSSEEGGGSTDEGSRPTTPLLARHSKSRSSSTGSDKTSKSSPRELTTFKEERKLKREFEVDARRQLHPVPLNPDCKSCFSLTKRLNNLQHSIQSEEKSTNTSTHELKDSLKKASERIRELELLILKQSKIENELKEAIRELQNKLKLRTAYGGGSTTSSCVEMSAKTSSHFKMLRDASEIDNQKLPDSLTNGCDKCETNIKELCKTNHELAKVNIAYNKLVKKHKEPKETIMIYQEEKEVLEKKIKRLEELLCTKKTTPAITLNSICTQTEGTGYDELCIKYQKMKKVSLMRQQEIERLTKKRGG